MRSIRPGVALLPLRLFLGVTFTYAGIQKLSDPGFLHAGSSTYIGTQLTGFADGTPGGFLLRTFAIPHPELAGVGVAIFEIVVGLLVAAGLMTRLAALAGLGLNLIFFLTASWHTSPYFLGSDIVFVFAWLPFVLAGAQDQPALENVLDRPPPGLARRLRLAPPPVGGPEGAPLSRRALLAELGGLALGLAGLAALLKGSYNRPGAIASARRPSATGAAGPASGGKPTGGGDSASGGSSGVPAEAVRLAPSSRLPAGQGATYPDPSDGSPDILIRDSGGELTAFSAVCTHAGCTVGYQGGQLVCPCHGAVYNARTGAVEAGPAPAALAQREVLEHGGNIYALPS